MSKLYQLQPPDCRKPLPTRENLEVAAYLKRVLAFDPSELYDRLQDKINPTERYNYVNFSEMFPKRPDKICACGCGQPVPVGKGSWASKDCQLFAICVWQVIGGRAEFMSELFKAYNGHDLCTCCGERKFVDIDHIFPVSKGGGGCWLSNFQPICKKCHTEKTRSDFGWEKLKSSKNYE